MYKNDFVCRFQATGCVVILLLYVGVTRVLHQTKPAYLLVDDGEMNTKMSFELGEIWLRINNNFQSFELR